MINKAIESKGFTNAIKEVSNKTVPEKFHFNESVVFFPLGHLNNKRAV